MKLVLSLAALTALLVGAVQWRAHQVETRAEAEFPPQGQIIEVEGRKIHALRQGQGPDLIILHGASGSIGDFTMELVPALAKRFRVTVFDRPGFGWSEPATGMGGIWTTRSESPQEQARVIRAAAQQLGITRPIILGHSYAGSLAMAWALEFPEEPAGLVMLGAVSQPWPGGVARMYHINGSYLGSALAVPLLTAFASAEKVHSVVAQIFRPQPVPEAYHDRAAVPLSLRRSTLRVNARQLTALQDHVAAMAPEFARLRLPVAIIHGDKDRIVPAETHAIPLHAQLSDSRLTLLDGIGHMPHHGDISDVVTAIHQLADRAALP